MSVEVESHAGRVRWVRTFAVVVLVAVVSTALGVLFIRWIGFARGPAAFVVALTPWWLAATLVATIALAILRSRWGAVGLLVVLLGAPTVMPLFIAETAPKGSSVTVMTINLTKGRASVEDVVRIVRENNVQLLAVQELTPEARAALKTAGLDQEMPYAHAFPAPSASGSGLWSQTPLGPVTEWEGFAFVHLESKVRIADRSVTVVAVHPSAPGPLLSGRWRAEQRRLAERASLIRDGAVLLGDFNATSDHPEVRRLQREGFAEARDQAGGGLQFTFPVARGPFPVAGLDRSMVRDVPWVATRATALNVSGGDHRAFVVEYAIGTS